MLNPSPNTQRLLALSVTTQGIGYGVFDGPLLLLDWGVARLPKPRDDVPRSILRRFSYYRPHLVLLEDCHDRSTRKGARSRHLIAQCARQAHVLDIPVVCYSRTDIRRCFAALDACTKDQIAAALVRRLPELRWQLPAKRRIWTAEDRRHGIFAAVSLALTHLQIGRSPAKPPTQRWWAQRR